MISFYFPSNSSLKVSPLNKTPCEGEPVYVNVCENPSGRFEVSAAEVKRSYVLQDISLTITGRVINNDLSSLTRPAPIVPVREAYTSMIKNVELAIGSYVIDTSGGHYAMREYILKYFLPASVGDNNILNAPTHLFDGSREFPATFHPFKYQTAPKFHMIPSELLSLKVDFHDANHFVVQKVGSSNKRSAKDYDLKLTSQSLIIPGAKLDNDLIQTLARVRSHSRLAFSYKQCTIAKQMLRKGIIEERLTQPFFKRTQATRFIVVMTRSKPHNIVGPAQIKLESMDLLSIAMFEGRRLIDSKIYLEATNPDFTALYAKYLKHRQAGGLVGAPPSLAEFAISHTFFVFERSPTPAATGGVGFNSAATDDGQIRLSLNFSNRLKHDVDIYCMAETDVNIEMGYGGRIDYTSLLEDEKYGKVPPAMKVVKRARRSLEVTVSGSVDTFVHVEQLGSGSVKCVEVKIAKDVQPRPDLPGLKSPDSISKTLTKPDKPI